MKLITEQIQEVNYLTEKKEDGGKAYYIEGPFLQTEVANRNGRVYRKETMRREVNRYIKEFVETKRAFGELGHPDGPGINLDRVSHMIIGLKEEGNDFIGRAKIMTETPMGRIVKNLIDEGAQLGVSSRGMGSLKQTSEGVNEVQDDFYLATAADIVADPSAPDAFVRGIMEGKEFWFNPTENRWVTETAEVMQHNMRKMTAKQIEEQKFAIFERYLNEIAGVTRTQNS
jgi:hypothetical protein